ncbi:MAG: hypothetical protein ACRD0J_00485, partial [Acidimicrobiales bacterium]
MTRLSGWGIEVETLPGWDAHLYRRPRPERGVTRPVLHLANFQLPPGRGDYGSGAVERMGPGHVLVVMLEMDPSSASTALYSSRGVPVMVPEEAFAPTTLQRGVPGQSGAQRFFQEAGRAFSLYAVLGGQTRRSALVAAVNRALAGIAIGPS